MPVVFIDSKRETPIRCERGQSCSYQKHNSALAKVYNCVLEVSTEPNVSVANRAGTRCMWVVSAQDMRVGCCTPPMCPEQSDGEGTMHMFQMTEKSSAPVTHILWPFCFTPPVPVVSPGLGVGQTEVTIGSCVCVCLAINLTTNKPAWDCWVCYGVMDFWEAIWHSSLQKPSWS